MAFDVTVMPADHFRLTTKPTSEFLKTDLHALNNLVFFSHPNTDKNIQNG